MTAAAPTTTLAKSLHPGILTRQIAKETDSNPLIHQAVAFELNRNRSVDRHRDFDLLNLDKLIELGFDINVVNAKGEMALHLVFKCDDSTITQTDYSRKVK